MVRRLMLYSALFSLLMLLLTPCSYVHSTETIRVPAGGLSYYYFTDLDEGDTIKVWFKVVRGPDITVFICDAENFARYTRGETATVYGIREDCIEASINFPVPHGGTWYVVFDNTDELFTDVIVECEVSAMKTSAPGLNTMMVIIGIAVIAAIAIVVIVVAIVVVKSKRAAPPPTVPLTPPYYQRIFTNYGFTRDK